MADSNITKQALAAALKKLLETEEFEKISVSDICERCHMNRKSFYYHFKDKYDLANWIFDTEFLEIIQKNAIDVDADFENFEESWNELFVVCEYFYENRNFYNKLLQIQGQNSFSEHFRNFLRPILHKRIPHLTGEQELSRMVYDFIVDGVAGAFERWLLDKNCATAEEFLRSIRELLQIMVLGLSRRIQNDPQWLEALYTEE